jgi:hypothetical protein
MVFWGIVEMGADASKRLPALAVVEIVLEVSKNRRTIELCIIPDTETQSQKTLDAADRPNNGNEALLIRSFFAFRAGRPAVDGSQNRIMGIHIIER